MATKNTRPKKAATNKVAPEKIKTADSRADIVARYGDKGDDLISRVYRDSHLQGDHWCVLNAQKYARRFISNGSVKSGNVEDLKKAIDYLQRCLEFNEQNPKKSSK